MINPSRIALPTTLGVPGRSLAVGGGDIIPIVPLSTGPNSVKRAVVDAEGWKLVDSGSSDRGGARTHDQRINLRHRLSPTTPPTGVGPQGCCASGLYHRHRRRAASSLWGRGRRSVGPLPADCPIPRLFAPSRSPLPACVVVAGALRVSQQIAAFTRRGSRSSRARLLLVLEVRCSTD